MPTNFVCIATFDTAHEAHLTRGLLESAGIPAFLRNEHLVSVNSFYSFAVGGVEVMVPEECAADALRFLQGEVAPPPTQNSNKRGKAPLNAPPEVDAADGDMEEAPPVCPHCGGRIERRRKLWPALAFLLFCGVPPGESPVWRCTSCGKKTR